MKNKITIIIASCVLIPTLAFSGSYADRKKNEEQAKDYRGRANVSINGERADIITRDKVIKRADPLRPEKTVDSAVRHSQKTGKDAAILIEKDDSFSGRLRERQLRRELRSRGLEDDVEIIEY